MKFKIYWEYGRIAEDRFGTYTEHEERERDELFHNSPPPYQQSCKKDQSLFLSAYRINSSSLYLGKVHI